MKMKPFKKVIAIVLALVLITSVVGCTPISMSKQWSYDYNDDTFEMNEYVHQTSREEVTELFGKETLEYTILLLEEEYQEPGATFNFPDFYGKENEYDTFSPLTFKSISKLEWRWIRVLKMSKAINNVDGTVQMLTAEHYEYERINNTING